MHKQLLVQLGDSLAAAGRKIRSRYHEGYAGTTPASDAVLAIIATEGPINVKTLARYLLVSPGAATQHVAALEKDGAISRVMSDKDRREIIVELTSHGKELYAQIRAKRLLLYEEVFGGLDEAELHQLVILLTKVSNTTQKEE